MGIVANFDMAGIEAMLEQFVGSAIKGTVRELTLLGMKCVNYAREIPDPEHGGNGFTDHTGNLRSSIGFKIFVGGEAVNENYKLYRNGHDGLAKGKALADKVGAGCGEDQIMLVITAGMEYAVYVESDDSYGHRGRDVIASSELLAKQEWPKMKKKIDEMVKRQMKKFR